MLLYFKAELIRVAHFAVVMCRLGHPTWIVCYPCRTEVVAHHPDTKSTTRFALPDLDIPGPEEHPQPPTLYGDDLYYAATASPEQWRHFNWRTRASRTFTVGG